MLNRSWNLTKAAEITEVSDHTRRMLLFKTNGNCAHFKVADYEYKAIVANHERTTAEMEAQGGGNIAIKMLEV